MTLNEREQGLLKVPIPKRTDTYTPISHGSFIFTIQKHLDRLGYSIKHKMYVSNNNGNQVIGVYRLSLEDSLKEIGLSIGFKNSYDKSMKAAFAIGANVIVCSNGMFTGEMTFAKKHMGSIDEQLEGFIATSISIAEENFSKMIALKDGLKQVLLNSGQVNEIIGDLFFSRGILRTEQMGYIKAMYNKPLFDYGVPKESAWFLYNCITFSLDQRNHPGWYMGQHSDVLHYFRHYCGFSDITFSNGDNDTQIELIDDETE